jgi:hypothetical protein
MTLGLSEFFVRRSLADVSKVPLQAEDFLEDPASPLQPCRMGN